MCVDYSNKSPRYFLKNPHWKLIQQEDLGNNIKGS